MVEPDEEIHIKVYGEEVVITHTCESIRDVVFHLQMAQQQVISSATGIIQPFEEGGTNDPAQEGYNAGGQG